MAIRYVITSMHMVMPASAYLFHGLLVSMEQLCKAVPSLWGQGIQHYSQEYSALAVAPRGGLSCGGCDGCGLAWKQYGDLFHGLLVSMGQLWKTLLSPWDQ